MFPVSDAPWQYVAHIKTYNMYEEQGFSPFYILCLTVLRDIQGVTCESWDLWKSPREVQIGRRPTLLPECGPRPFKQTIISSLVEVCAGWRLSALTTFMLAHQFPPPSSYRHSILAGLEGQCAKMSKSKMISRLGCLSNPHQLIYICT